MVNKLQSFVQAYFHQILMLLLAGGGLMVLVELLWTGHTDGIQLVGVIASALMVVLAIVGLFAHGTLRVTLAVLFVLLSITGLVGVLEHNEAEGEADVPALVVNRADAGMMPISYRSLAPQQEDEEGEAGEVTEAGEAGESAPPPLAPLSLSGLALMGAVVLLGRRDDN
jgi:hypothetical protein